MLLTLETLKSRTLSDQAETIAALAGRNLDLYEHLQPLLSQDSEDSIYRVAVSPDQDKVVRLALLAVVAADIASVPDSPTRRTYLRRLCKLCRHLAVEYNDVVALQRHVAQIQDMLLKRAP